MRIFLGVSVVIPNSVIWGTYLLESAYSLCFNVLLSQVDNKHGYVLNVCVPHIHNLKA